MNMVDGMRDQLLGELVNRGLIRSLDESNTQGEISDLVRSVLVRSSQKGASIATALLVLCN